MKQPIKRIIFGFFIWLILFIIAAALWDVETNLPKVNMMWYGAIMNAAWAISFSIGAFFYFKTIKENYLKEGVISGITWYIVAVVLEFVILAGLFKISLNDFYPSILAYFNTLFITMLIGFILDKKQIKNIFKG